MATLLVTGGCGFIGANFIHYWLQRHPHDRIVNVDLLTYAGNPANLAALIENNKTDNYIFAHGDIADLPFVQSVFEEHAPDVLINFAAESHNSRAILHPADFFRTNVMGVQTLLEAARRFGISRFHHISTCEVFGDLALDSPDQFAEDYPYRPRTPYNASKAAADHAVRAYFHTYQLPVSISICANNYGPYQFPEKLIPRFITLLMQNKPMTLYQSSNHKREWIHVRDHCAALEMVLQKGAIGETYNIGNACEMDVEEVAARLIAAFGVDESYKQYVPDRPSHDRRYLLNSQKIRRQLGWQPTINLDSGFAEVVEWYRNNESWWQPLLAKSQVDEQAWQHSAASSRV